MDDFDYCESFSGANSFRARSNTWPLNRPDFITPASASACIDDTLPEIDLEDDDLFTTADNWTTADLVDHDPMSWDPILNGPPPMLDNSSSMSNSNNNNNINNNHTSSSNNSNNTSATEQTTQQQPAGSQQIQPAMQTLSLNPHQQQLHQQQQLHLDQHSYHQQPQQQQHHHQQQQHHLQQQQQHLLNGVKEEDPTTCTQQHNIQHFPPNNNINNNNNNNTININGNNNNNDTTLSINGQAAEDHHTLTPANIVKLEQQQQQQQFKNHNGQSQLLQQQQQLHHQIMPTVNGKAKLNTPRRNAWGNMSYADLISQAINSTDDKRLTLSQIYDWMVQNVPYFKDKGDSNSSAGWKNSVRHNLSLHNRFKRIQNEGTGKSSWWIINPEAIIGKCARRRAASMEASRYEKKRGRAKKRVEAIRNGIISYPSLTDSSITDSFSTEQLNVTAEAISSDNLHTQASTMLHIAPQPPIHQTDSYYQQLTQHHQLLNHQQPTTSIEHLDLVGHTVYMTEPCNDCNCPEIMNCTNALSLL